jgi:hypothetical protein
MKKTTIILFLLATTAILSIYVGCGPSGPDSGTSNPSRLPANVLQSCIISQDSFNTWFASGHATENGLVLPANSVTFGHNNNCEFYQWSWQMFAWMTSPASGSGYGSGGTVMESPVFYTASAADSTGNRYFIPHISGQPLRVFPSPIVQNGPNNLPMIKDKKGNLLEVVPRQEGVKPMLLSGTRRVTINSVDIDAAGKPVFKDQAGKIIQNPKALITLKGNITKMVQEFTASNGQSVFLTAQGEVVESEVGQATHNGLISRAGSLVYYISMVNDVYAFFLSGAKDSLISGAEFPITAQQRDSICAIARANGTTLPDSNALAIEIKTSWVEAETVPDPDNYITIDAFVPTYNKMDSVWVPNGEKKVKLAMLGMHVVGSTAGHPEMVWATFEHNQNAPNAAYQYLNADSVMVTQPADSSGQWTLSSNASDPNPNVAHIYVPKNSDSLKAIAPYGITASNSSLVYPWGSEANVTPNAEDGSSAASNSEVISINNSVLSKLVGNDIRKNYILIGATWTSGGKAPTGQSYSTNPSSPGVAIGTSLLANSTMETYLQLNYTTCFYCHSNGDTLNPSLLPGDLSHIYTQLQALKNFKTTDTNK